MRAAAHRPPLAGYALACAGACLFATKGVLIKLAYAAGATTEALLVLRFAFSLPLYLAVGTLVLLRGRAFPEPRLAAQAAAVGVLGYWFASYTDFLGLQFISVQFERLILFTYPAFTVLFGALFFRQRLRPAALGGVALSYAGLILMFSAKLQTHGHDVAKGAGLVLSAAIAFALYQVIAKDLIVRLGARLFTCIAMSGAAAATFTQFVLTQPASAYHFAPAVLGYAAVLALFATVIPSFLLNAALEKISPQANGAIGSLSPVITLFLAVLVLHEHIGWVEIAATALVLAGVGWFTLADSRLQAAGASSAPIAKARN